MDEDERVAWSRAMVARGTVANGTRPPQHNPFTVRDTVTITIKDATRVSPKIARMLRDA